MAPQCYLNPVTIEVRPASVLARTLRTPLPASRRCNRRWRNRNLRMNGHEVHAWARPFVSGVTPQRVRGTGSAPSETTGALR